MGGILNRIARMRHVGSALVRRCDGASRRARACDRQSYHRSSSPWCFGCTLSEQLHASIRGHASSLARTTRCSCGISNAAHHVHAIRDDMVLS